MYKMKNYVSFYSDLNSWFSSILLYTYAVYSSINFPTYSFILLFPFSKSESCLQGDDKPASCICAQLNLST